MITKLVKDWSETFGLNCSKEKKIPSDASFDLSLIHEEFQETYQAAAEKDLKEYQDGLGDVLWTTIRAMLNAGIDPEETIQAIYESNMSKTDVSMEDAKLTKAKYKAQGIETYMEERRNLFITHRVSDGKVLKSINFTEPKFM